MKEPAAEISANLEYPACPLCGSDGREFPFRLRDGFTVARCVECGFHYLYPRLVESAMQQVYRELSYYEGGACGYADTSYTAQEFALRATFKRLLHNLAEHGVAGGELLEIGCGYGYLLDEARSFFDRRVGTDFSPQGAEIARATGAEVFVGGIEQVPLDAKFDFVIGTQLIEHVYEPVSFVKRLISHTKPGGHIVLATPDIGGLLRKVMGRHWPSFKVPEHVLYFDYRTLSSLMHTAGLSNVRRLPYPHAFPFGLIVAKFGFKLPPWLGHFKVWVPATTVAAYGRAGNV
ncbi:MAG TPA: class I SAM-dependent methyltransferase [Candidatus Udaeobacter sp.]|jgi:2-polyprenyl-3-methyl-5-hydroxy-6-metoxy-1,4-benzoquinol methylase